MNHIHSTAVVDPRAILGNNNVIGPFCVVHGGVTMGDGNRFESHVSVGSPAEKWGYLDVPGPHGLSIGNGNVFREFVTLNAGVKRPTRVENYCLMLRGSHLSHDSVLENEVVVSCNVQIGGESYVMWGANLGMSCVLHQYSLVGAWAMIGMGAVCTKKSALKPGGVFVGNPARYLKENRRTSKWGTISDVLLSAAHERWAAMREGR